MAILSCLANEGNANLVGKTISFFERFVPDDLLRVCNVYKAADRGEGDTNSYMQFSLFSPPDDTVVAAEEKRKRSKELPALGYAAKGILQDKVISGFLNETFNQSKNPSGSFGFTTTYSSRTWYRFDRLHINWERLMLETASNIITYVQKEACPNGHRGSLAVDDSLYPRKVGVHGDKTKDRVTEFVGIVFDHTIRKNKIGFRMMTAIWTDGNNSIPVAQSLLTTRDENLMIGPRNPYDRRTWEGMRRELAVTKGTDVFVQFVKRAIDAGIQFDEVLTDTWFSKPAQAIEIIKLGTHLIAMATKGHAKYGILPEGSKANRGKLTATDLEWYDAKEIYSRHKKRRGTSKYLLSVTAWIKDKDGTLYPVKLVYARNHSNRKDWVVILCTNLTLSELEILRRYCYRWNVECYFKVAKSYLGLLKCRSTSYDALTAHVTIVTMRFMMLSVERFDEIVPRTIERIFNAYRHSTTERLIQEACLKFGDILLESCDRILKLTDAQIKAVIMDFISSLPVSMQAFFDLKKLEAWE